jgi:hypothetical protein
MRRCASTIEAFADMPTQAANGAAADNVAE